MSDTTTMPFQPGTMAAAPEAPEVDAPSGGNRMLLVLVALAGLAVLAIAAYFLLFAGGGDDKTASATPPAKAGVLPSTAPSTAPETTTLPKISARNFGTDPFKALLSAAPVGTDDGHDHGHDDGHDDAAGHDAAGHDAAGHDRRPSRAWNDLQVQGDQRRPTTMRVRRSVSTAAISTITPR